MARQGKSVEEELNTLKVKVQEGQAVIGTERVLKALRGNSVSLSKILLAKNCPVKTREDILHYARLAKIPVLEAGVSNEELGVFCKKNFLVSVLGLVGE